jgi:hypothetical protein
MEASGERGGCLRTGPSGLVIFGESSAFGVWSSELGDSGIFGGEFHHEDHEDHEGGGRSLGTGASARGIQVRSVGPSGLATGECGIDRMGNFTAEVLPHWRWEARRS